MARYSYKRLMKNHHGTWWLFINLSVLTADHSRNRQSVRNVDGITKLKIQLYCRSLASIYFTKKLNLVIKLIFIGIWCGIMMKSSIRTLICFKYLNLSIYLSLCMHPLLNTSFVTHFKYYSMNKRIIKIFNFWYKNLSGTLIIISGNKLNILFTGNYFEQYI